MNNNICPVCSNSMVIGIRPWHSRCDVCLYEKSDLQPNINALSAHDLIDENSRESGLRAVRMSNFKKLLDVITFIRPDGGTLVDVGCAHGWFVEVASSRFDAVGIEPDEAVFNATAARGIKVRMGYFPGALKTGEQFDIIVFNDVIEHIHDISSVLAACHERLNDGGLLVINLPSSDGVFYRLSRLFGSVRKFGFFERLWQKDLPSPHVHYFNTDNLRRLLGKCNFKTVRSGTLPTLGVSGLYTRIAYTGNLGPISRVLVYCGVALSIPFLRLLPSDIVYVVAEKS